MTRRRRRRAARSPSIAMGGNERSAARLRHVSHHVGRRAAFPSAIAGPAALEAYHLVELAPSDAADCVGLMPGVDMWRTSIEDAARSWGYRVRGGASELVACAFLYTAAGDSPSAGHCTVSNVLTSKDHRRRGLAKSLMLELLRAANGRPTSLYASEMGAPLYKQLGFKTVDAAKGFRCERQFDPEAHAAGVMVSVLAAPTAAEIAEVGALDSAMFGGNRMALLQTALGHGSDATLAVARDPSGKVSAFAASAGPNAFSQGVYLSHPLCTTPTTQLRP
jgi:GNAT superfamily N-acetyltransferase